MDKLLAENLRGISIDTYKKYQCFFARADNRIIMPTTLPDGNKSFSAVLIMTKRRELDAKGAKYAKVKAEEDKARGIFNLDKIVPDQPVIVVEGEIDALSIVHCGYENVIALGGQSVGNLCSWLKNNPAEYQFVVLFDNDDSGKKKSPDAVNDLLRAGYKAISKYLKPDADKKVDANDILVGEGADVLKSYIDEIVQAVQVELPNVKFTPPPKIPIDWEFAEDTEEKKKKYPALSIDEIKRILGKIPVESLCHNDWALTVGGGLVDWGQSINDLDTAFDVFNEYSSKDTRPKQYSEQNCKSTWNSLLKGEFKKKKRGIGSLKKLAKQCEMRRLKELQEKPQNETRDREIINLIKDILDSGEYGVKATANNMELIFDNDPLISGLFGYDAFNRKIRFLKKCDWEHTDAWQDSDDAQLRFYLRKNYDEMSNAPLIADAVTVFAYRNSFHPVKKYLDSLKWDGVQRAEELFIKYLGVDDSEYSRIITRTWLLAAVTRIYCEGCKFQWALVLQGEQGIGKSFICETLGGEWLIKLTDSLDDSHAIDDIQAAWLVEIEEWVSGRKSEINAQKSFISRGQDTARLSYERRAANYPRHCVFVVTVNDFAFLRDPTGNRRFKILECHNQKFHTGDNFNAEIAAQIWAEVMTWFKETFANGFDEKKLELSKEINLQAEEIAAGFTADDGTADEIYSFVNIPIPPNYIWQLMTKDERRKFFSEGSIAFTEFDLVNRRESLSESWKKALVDETEFNHAIAIRREFLDKNDKMCFYGKVQRKTICAAELFNECFVGKKPMQKINDALRKLEGWKELDRLRNTDTQYPDQKNPYGRINYSHSEMPSADEILPTNGFSESDFEDIAIPDDAVPF